MHAPSQLTAMPPIFFCLTPEVGRKCVRVDLLEWPIVSTKWIRKQKNKNWLGAVALC